MPFGINRTIVDIMEDLRQFLLAMYAIALPEGVHGVDYEVIAGQNSFVPQLTVENYMVMTLVGHYQLTLAPITIPDEGEDGPPAEMRTQTPMEYGFRIDIYGGLSESVAPITRNIFFSPYGYALFKRIGRFTVPLSCEDANYSPFDKNGEMNYDPRHILNVTVQSNSVLTVPQDYFNQIDLEVHGVI